MMKKLICFLAFLFLVPVAFAEDAAPYIPGETTKTWFIEAFERGDMVLADLYCDLTFNDAAADLFGMDSEMLSALSDALGHAALTIGAGQTEDGLRVLLAGQYTADDGQAAALDATLDLTQSGVSIMSSIIPGERLNAEWTTLLALAGVSEAEILQLLDPQTLDVQAMAEELAAQSEASMEMIAQIAAPYGETILAHLSALPVEVQENVPAEQGFPAAATEICVTVTGKSVGNLFIALAEQLEQDATLCAILDSMLAESGEDVTTVQLCQAVRQSAAENLTDEEYPIYLYIGMDEAGNFLYLNAVTENVDGEELLLALIAAPDEDDPSLMALSFELLSLTAEDEISDGLSILALYPLEQAEENAVDLQIYTELYADKTTVFSGEFALGAGSVLTEDELRGEALACSLALAAADAEDVVSMAISVDSLRSETAEGGEQSSLAGTLDLGSGDMHLPLSCEVYSLTENTANGPTMTITSFFYAPNLGMEKIIGGCTLYTASYAPDLSAVTNLALETAAPEEIDALAQRAMISLQNTLVSLLELLPPALMGE